MLVLSGGEDEVLLENLSPSISGILFNNEELGYLAAQTLERMLRGEPVPRDQAVPPVTVVVRESTDAFAVDDSAIASALRFIWKHVADQVTVDQVAQRVPMSRRTLTRRFTAQLGRTPSEEIRASRIETAKRLLSTTNLSLVEVTQRAGLADQSLLSRFIKSHTGMTPSEYRRRFGSGR